jgi:thioredoxin 1
VLLVDPMGTDLIEVTDASFAREVLHSSLPVLLGCWAPCCLPSRVMGPIMEELATELAGTVNVATLNADENPETVVRLRIRRIPTLLLFRSGEVIGEMIGAAACGQIEAAVFRRLRDEG